MPRCAVVRETDNICINIIMAEPTDQPYEGTFLIDVDNMNCGIGWVYDPIMNDFTNPNPPPPDPDPYVYNIGGV